MHGSTYWDSTLGIGWTSEEYNALTQRISDSGLPWAAGYTLFAKQAMGATPAQAVAAANQYLPQSEALPTPTDGLPIAPLLAVLALGLLAALILR